MDARRESTTNWTIDGPLPPDGQGIKAMDLNDPSALNEPEMSMVWLNEKPDTLRHHLDNLGVDISTYARDKRLCLGEHLLSLRRIYLDTKYWVNLRDVLLGRSKTCAQTRLYELLTELRATDRVICPISYSVFVELLRQKDVTTRRATAHVIDDLADGCCILPPHEVSKREVMHFIRRTTSPSADLYPVAQMVWTKVGFVFGDRWPMSDALPAKAMLAMQKAMDDLLWSESCEELISRLPVRVPTDDEDLGGFAKQLTCGKMSHAHEFTTFEQVFASEVAGHVDVIKEELEEMSVYLYRKAGGEGDIPPAQVKESGRLFGNLIYNAFRLNRISTELPGIHIPCALHAALRCDGKRHYKPGDCEDFRHATVALPYFDFFFTEKSLGHLLCTKPLQLHDAYAIKIMSKDDDIIESLESMQRDLST